MYYIGRFGITVLLLKAIVLDCILIIVSYIDFKYRIIPNKIVLITLILGIIFSFVGEISLTSALIGMILGGGMLFLLALIPNAMGGGDIKFMFAIGLFLGYQKVIWALLIAFISASIISLLLLIFKIKGPKEHIPFGPFLALGAFIAFHFV